MCGCEQKNLSGISEKNKNMFWGIFIGGAAVVLAVNILDINLKLKTTKKGRKR